MYCNACRACNMALRVVLKNANTCNTLLAITGSWQQLKTEFAESFIFDQQA